MRVYTAGRTPVLHPALVSAAPPRKSLRLLEALRGPIQRREGGKDSKDVPDLSAHFDIN